MKVVKRVFAVFIAVFPIILNADALIRENAISESNESPSESQYVNFAEKGLYENEHFFLQIPQWHFYDNFGNKILDGFYLYGLSQKTNDIGKGISNIALHPFLKKMLDNLVEVSDLHDSSGVLVMVGDKINSTFTPFSLKQTIFAGSRFDAFYRQNSISFLTNRISYTGFYGMYSDESRPEPLSDWLTGVHAVRKFGEKGHAGATYVNIHHSESGFVDRQFSGTDCDTSPKTPTGLSLYGLDGNFSIKNIQLYGEYVRSQVFLDGRLKPEAGNAGVLNGYYDIFDKWRWGGELYLIGSRFQTDFACPVHEWGDQLGGFQKYQYSLVEDNDDNDEVPENNVQSKMDWFPQMGDFDGTIPVNYDRNKNGIWDYEEDFLSYEADPPDSRILFDRNNNGVPDEVEDDPYPDYPYVPSYYLPAEKSWKNTDPDYINDTISSTPVHKGLDGFHIYSRYNILENLQFTAGGIFEKSEEKTYQTIYENGIAVSEKYASEKALCLYLLTGYQKNIGRDKYLLIENYLRRVQDNIPNHTQSFSFNPDSQVNDYYPVPDFLTTNKYHIIEDELEYRDVFSEAIRAEFSISANRGLNFTSSAKYEFRKNFPRPEFNYPDKNISSLWLINKCKYIYPVPLFKNIRFFKDMFLIPRFKNVYEFKTCTSVADSAAAACRRNAVSNTASLLWEWRITAKSALTAGGQLKRFDDLIDNGENYFQPSFSIQLTVKDRYRGCAMALTAAFTRYAYLYDSPHRAHDIRNNAHRVGDVEGNIHSHAIHIKVYCGYL